jgi:DNA-binding NarL/FixJ family response regulator
MTPQLRVLLVDDQALIRGGLRLILEAQPDLQVVGEAADGESAVHMALRLRPDIILMDVRMPSMDGLEATKRILGEGGAGAPRILILTTFDLDEYVYVALQAGASGFLLKDAAPDQLVAAVRTVSRGDALLAPSITRRLVERFARPNVLPAAATEQLGALTAREREVFLLVARGLSNAEIADRLVIGEATVKTHVAAVLGKLELRNRAQAVVAAYEARVVLPDGAMSSSPSEGEGGGFP